MKKENEVREELENLSPHLARFKQADLIPQVPEHYFREMQADVLWKVRREASAAPIPGERPSVLDMLVDRIRQWLRRPVYAVAFATLALMIVAAIWVFTPRQEPDFANGQWSTLTEEDVFSYIEANYQDFDTELLVQVLQINQALPGTTSGMSEEEADQFIDALIKELDVSALEELL